MRLAVIIPNYTKEIHQIRMLERALESIKSHEPWLLSSTYVVDDCSPMQNTETMLRRLAKTFGVQLALHEHNMGYSGAVNTGRMFAGFYKHDTVLTMNSDVELTTPVLRYIDEGFKDERTGIIGAKLLYPTGRVQAAGFEVRDDGSPVEYEKSAYEATEPRRYVMGVTGALQAFRIGCGEYSTKYRLGFEDVEFCMRAWMNDWKVLYDPRIVAIHSESATRGKALGEVEKQSYEQWMNCDFPAMNLGLIRDRLSHANLTK
jgi:GT2 family glycosyltransferase